MPRLRRVVDATASAVDWLPKRAAAGLLRRYFDVVQQLAGRDARYAAITGSDRGMDVEEFIYQLEVEDEIRRQLVFEPLVPLLVRIERGVTAQTTAHARWAAQRLRRGYDDRSIWGLDRHLCRTLGQQLGQLADEAHGWPGSSSDFPTFEDWTTALRQAAQQLDSYADRDGEDDEQERVAAAQRALHWVGDNLPDLWD